MLLRKQPNDNLAFDRLQNTETHSSWLKSRKSVVEGSPQKSQNMSLGLPQGAGNEAALGCLAGTHRYLSQCCPTLLNTMCSLFLPTPNRNFLVPFFAELQRPGPSSPASSDDQLLPLSQVVSCGLINVA